MQIPLLEGRDFTDADAEENATVAIVNKRFADHFFKGGSAIGKRLGWGGGPTMKLTIEIIGVVADSLYEGPREGVRRQVFVPNWGRGSATFYVRTTTGSASAYNAAAERGEATGFVDAGLSDEDARSAARRDAADRPFDRAALGRIRPARHDPRLGRSLRRDGVRRRSAQEGARHSPRPRRPARSA